LWPIHTLCSISVSFAPVTDFPKELSLDDLKCMPEIASYTGVAFSLKFSVTLLAEQAQLSIYSETLNKIDF